MREFLDYFGLSTEPSILIDANLEKLKKKYFILESFQLSAPSPSDRVLRSLESCVSFYDESLWSRLHFSLYFFICNMLDYYGLQPTQVTLNTIRIILVFIICCSFIAVDHKVFLFKTLFVLKKYLTEKDW